MVVAEKPVPLRPLCPPRLVMSQKRTCLKQQPWGQSEKKKEPRVGRRCSRPTEQVVSLSTASAADKFTSPRSTRDLTSKHDAGRKPVGDWSFGGIVRKEGKKKKLRRGRATPRAALLFNAQVEEIFGRT